MERRIEEDVEGWPTRPFEDGYEGLRQLAAADFSGVVRAGGASVFFVNGRIVGVYDGDLEDVDEAAGTAHKAPHPSLPLLYAMQATGGDTRAKYYTNETSISEVDDTLSSGSFTGYVELSENVLSGDYYQLYHGGRSMSVAFVGNSGRMITGEEAFERADDEVGIYEVVDVDLDVSDVPEPAGSDADAEAGADSAAAGAAGSADDDATPGSDGTAAPPAGGDADAGASSDAEPEDSASQSGPTDGAAEPAAEPGPPADADARNDAGAETTAAEPAPDATADADTSAADRSDAAGTTDAEPTPPADGESPSQTSTDRSDGDRSSDADESAADTERETPADAGHETTAVSDRDDAGGDAGSSSASAADGAGATRAAGSDPSSAKAGSDGQRSSEAAWREATTVPSLDPDESEEGAPPASSQGRSHGGRATTSRQSSGQARGQSRQTTSEGQARKQRRSESSQGAAGASQRSASAGDVDDTLEQEVLEREDRIDRLQQRVENLEDERDEIAEERDRLEERVASLTEENESLRSEIRSLEDEIEELEATAEQAEPAGAATTGAAEGAGGGAMTPRAALEGTDLFVRYDSKSEPTLEAAHGGSADAAAVNGNLRLDVHTQFEDAGVTVDGEPFEAFLQETMAYRFVEWLVRTLPYEIRETGSVDELRDLYDTLPEVDRVEFHGEVDREVVEGEEGAPSETFDVVVRDKMGEALFVANMNDARDPATGRMIVDLQEAASRVKDHSVALASAFFVTRSFFEPAALETASEATSGSLLSRDSRKSYVKLSRKQGYHLCLVEARGEDLHLNVPEL